MSIKIKHVWDYPRCGLCNGIECYPVYTNVGTWMSSDRFNYVSCKKCNLVYLCPRPDEKRMAKYYNPEWYWGNVSHAVNVGKNEENSNIYNSLYKNFRNVRNQGTALDIGAGMGLFLQFLRDKGWVISGTETSKEAISYAKKTLGIKLKKGDFLKLNFPANYYDLVTLNGVLEHLHKPLKTLIKVKSVLRPEGVIHLSVPNFSSFGSRLFKDKWYSLQPPTHLYHFTPKTAKSMLEAAGFKEIIIKPSSYNGNKYIIFESFRIKYSLKFIIPSRDKKVEISKIREKSKFSLIRECGKLFANVFSSIVAFCEVVFGMGEAMYIYAKK